MLEHKLFEIFKDCDFTDLNWDNFEDQIICNMNIAEPFSYECGCSKLAIIFSDKPYVVKIPFSCTTEQGNIVPFEGADNTKDNNWDYCLSEVLTYDRAKNLKIENFFAEIRLAATIRGYPIYVQERAQIYADITTERENETPHTFEELHNTREFCLEQRIAPFNLNWITDARNYFGEAPLASFLSFVRNFDIGDLHDGNIGYVADRPVLVDYSNFYC